MLFGCASGEHRVTWLSVDPDTFDAPEPAAEFRAAWVASVVNIDWPSAPALPAESQRAEILRILDLSKSLHLNAIVLQIRPSADALYASKLEPWSEFLTGVQGEPYPFDPLAFWVSQAHARAIDLHVWFNPFRARHPGANSPTSHTHVASVRPELVREYAGHLWLDPGEPEARAHSLRVIRDVVRRYDIDGVHLDDYFYPYPKDDAPFPDESSYERYRSSGGSLDRSAWRRLNINTFVRDLYAEVKAIKPHVLVGISPFGIWRPGHPDGVVGFDAYERLSADSRLWLRAGWLDYATPQLYWPVESEGQPYEPLLNWWASQNLKGRHLWPGLYLTRILDEGGWIPEEIIRQIRITRSHPNASGIVLFSMIGLLENRQGVSDLLSTELFDEPALIPSSPWLKSRPSIRIRPRIRENDGIIRISFRPTSNHSRWFVQSRRGGLWTTEILPGSAHSHDIQLGVEDQAVDALKVQAVDRLGVRTEPAVFSRLTPAPLRAPDQSVD